MLSFALHNTRSHMQQGENIIVQQLDFTLASIVYLATDTDALPRMVTGVTIRPGGNILYELSSALQTSYHIAAEITKDKPVW